MANRRFIDFPIASTSGNTDIILIWQDGANKQTTKATFLSGLPENLEDLNDVVISGLTNGQILRYDSVTGKWENTDQGNLDLNDLNDVSIVSPSNGQVLVYNSSTSQWENSSGGYVPYVGAVTTVDLGAQGLRAGYVRFDTTVASVPDEQGLMFWDADDETVDIILNGYTMKIGEDLFYPVKNQTGSTIAKGVAVRFNGTVGNSGRLLIAPFIADGSVPSTRFMGVTAEEILNGEDGKVLYFGRVRGINTNAFNEGDILYASTTSAGGYQTAIPVAPNNIVQVAAVVTKSATVGTIFVRPTLGSNINTDEGVKIVSVADKNLLQYQSGTSLWENKTLAQVLGGTSSQFVKGDASLDSTSYQPLLTNPVTGTGASGQVAFWNGTNSQTGDNGLFWDNTNKRLGVGMNSPTLSLTVRGNSANTNVISGTTIQNVSSFQPSNQTGNLTFGFNTTTADAYIYSGYDLGSIIFATRIAPNNFERWRITATGILQSNGAQTIQTSSGALTLQPTGGVNLATSSGNVGIGTNTPAAKLHTSTTTTGNSVGALLANPNQAGTADSVSLNFGLGRSVDSFLFSIPAITFGKEQQWTSAGSTVDGYLSFSTMLNESVTERMRITSGGNVGLGVTPSAWGSPFIAFQLGTFNQYIAGQTNAADMKLGTNHYYGSGNYRYGNSTDRAARYDIGNNGFAWNIAPSGTAGNAISFTQAMTLTSGGNVLIGTTTDNGQKLQVIGNTYSEGLHIATGQFVQGGSATNTFYTFSNISVNRVFLITLRQSGGGSNNVVAIGFTYGGSLGAYNIVQDNTNPVLFLTISASGLGLRLTTGSGFGTTTWDWTITQLK